MTNILHKRLVLIYGLSGLQRQCGVILVKKLVLRLFKNMNAFVSGNVVSAVDGSKRIS